MSKQTKNTLIMRSVKLLHILVVIALFAACAYLYYIPVLGVGNAVGYLSAACCVYLALYLLLGRIYHVYSVGTSRIRQLAFSQGLSLALSAAIGYVAVSVFKLRLVNPLPLLGLLAAQLVLSVLWSMAANRLYYAITPARKTVVIYAGEEDLQSLQQIEYFERKFRVIRYLQLPAGLEEIVASLEGVETVFAAGLSEQQRNTVIKHCVTNDIQCYFPPRVSDVLISGAEHIQAFSVPMLRIRGAKAPLEYRIIKRGFDIVASLLAILVASPFMLVTAIAIKAYDRGPVLYKQVRLTRGRKEFKVLKFRSMRVDAEKDGIARLSTQNDDRITPVGKIIRKIRFDELPQLFNILKGDMTIVGPRPERPEIAAQYEQEIPSFGLRLQVKAGLTGYAQVYGRYNTTPYDKLKMDLMYINRMSLVEDLRIMLATVKVLFMKDSTEGIEAGKTTASRREGAAEEKEPQNV